jgi:hypothetical protein
MKYLPHYCVMIRLALKWENWRPGLKVKILEAKKDVLQDEAAGQL